MNKGIIRRLLALALAGYLLAGAVLPAALAAGEDRITISSAEDWEEFARCCSLDAWSRGKTVTLTADLDLSGRDAHPVPTFGGMLLGQGHTISGLRLTAAGSNQGLFRYIQPGAVVRDLTVQGLVAPDGSRSTVGGLAGVNEGSIQNCAFHGVVTGENTVGGLVGRNGDSGQLVNCSAAGTVNGQTATGGIAGRNTGLLLQCVNRAGVNLTEWGTRETLTELDAESVLTDRAVSDEDSAAVLDGSTDTGGVAGYSSGVIQSCTNLGDVGYPHVGYNVGGIAGRQSGYLAGCVNRGAIHGRKDVGGIAGQAEPWLVLAPGSQTLDRLRAELDTLDRLVNRALDDAQAASDQVSASLTAMGEYTGVARDSSQVLLDSTMDFVDDNIAEVNTLASDVTNALDKISPAMDDLSDVGQRLERLSRRLDDALASLEDSGGAAAEALRSAAEELRQGQAELNSAMEAFQTALDAIYQAVFPDGTPTIPAPEDLEAARAAVTAAFEALRKAGEPLSRALEDIRKALEETGALPEALGDLRDAASSAAAIGRLLESAFDTIGDGVDQLTKDGPPRFSQLGESAREASGSLFDALGGLSGEMETLNGTVQDGSDALLGDLRAVSRQFNVVCSVLADAIDNLDGQRDEGIVQDTSDEDIAATREGKVADCQNGGAVEGDRNVGGVVGAMAIELDLDPEDDGADRFSFGSSYETKAVLQGCVNQGAVTAKKDCAGGIAGRMDLGTALECQSYGSVTSTGGDYTGGVAGFADAMVRRCFAKNVLSGGNYVGGVAGWASRLRDCCSIATIEAGTECLGAVAGGIESGGVLTGNRFVDTGLAGVDGVSYAGRAEPIPFAELAALPDIPAEFTAFTLTLVAEGETVAQIPFFYGDDLSRLTLPEVPAREDSYGAWPEFDTSGTLSDITLEAEYAPWITLAASQETDGKLSLALAEGQFTREAVLRVTDGAVSPPPECGEDAVVRTVSLTGTALGPEDTVPLRLLSPAEGGADVWQYRNGQWKPVETRRNGRYLLLDMEGTEGVFCLQPQADAPWAPLAIGGGAVLALLVLVLVRRKKQSAKAAARKAPETAADQEKTTV